MTTSHTRGPWMTLPDEADKPYVRIRGGVAGSRFKITNVLKPIYENPPEWEEEETRANVRLIAAAPELLDALRELLYAYDEFLNPLDGVATDAREAIAKATGAT